MSDYRITAKNWLKDDWETSFHSDSVTLSQPPTRGLAAHPKTGKQIESWEFPYTAMHFGDQQRFVRYWATRNLMSSTQVEWLLKDKLMVVPVEDCDVEEVVKP